VELTSLIKLISSVLRNMD